MRGSVVWQMILKDWQIHRTSIFLTMAGGVIALAVFQHGGETAMVLGGVWFFVALIVLGSMLPIHTIVNERKRQNLAFLMSLPISPIQYTLAKLVSSVGMFLVPWLTLVASAVLLIEIRGIVPRGNIPFTLILMVLPFIGFCLIAGAALVGESEGWGIAATVICNSSYWLAWYSMGQIPGLMAETKSPVPIWSSTVLTILCSELGFIVLILGVAFYLQSRKRDFI